MKSSTVRSICFLSIVFGHHISNLLSLTVDFLFLLVDMLQMLQPTWAVPLDEVHRCHHKEADVHKPQKDLQDVPENHIMLFWCHTCSHWAARSLGIILDDGVEKQDRTPEDSDYGGELAKSQMKRRKAWKSRLQLG